MISPSSYQVQIGQTFRIKPPKEEISFTLEVEEILAGPQYVPSHKTKTKPDITVCKVRRTDNSVESILKVIHNQKSQQYQTEADLCQKVSNAWAQSPTPYVVKFYGFLQLANDPAQPWKALIGGIHMKYYPLGTLFDHLYLKKKVCQLPEKELKPIFKSTLAGLHFLHTKANIAHRDIKLENVFLLQEANGIVGVLGDFGHSSPKEGKPIPGGGTQPMMTAIQGRGLTYTAPEARTNSPYGFKCDIWSLGVLFYIMLFGIDPTGNFTLKKDMYADHANVNWTTNFQGTPGFGSSDVELQFPQANPEVSLELKGIIKSMTNFVPDRRPTAHQILEHSYFSKNPDLAWIKY